MKYRLKRDLPFAKAGTELYTQLIKGTKICSMEERTKVYINAETFADQYGSVCLGMLSDLISTGWIEEARPREYYIAYNGDKILGVCGSMNETYLGTTRFVKVREVIE